MRNLCSKVRPSERKEAASDFMSLAKLMRDAGEVRCPELQKRFVSSVNQHVIMTGYKSVIDRRREIGLL